MLISFNCSTVLAIEFSLTPQVHYFDYLEKDEQGHVLNTETGWLNGIDGSSQIAYLNLTFAGHIQYLQGDVDYNGQTQAGQIHHTTTQQNIIQYGLSSAYEMAIYNLTLSPTVTLDNTHWRREIQQKGLVSALTEDYQWLTFKPSINFTYQTKNNQEISFNIGTTHTFNAAMKVHATSCTQAVTVYPKDGNGWFSQIEVVVTQGKNHTLSTFITYEKWTMTKSENHLTDSCIGPLSWSEPDNQTQLWSLGARFSF